MGLYCEEEFSEVGPELLLGVGVYESALNQFAILLMPSCCHSTLVRSFIPYSVCHYDIEFASSVESYLVPSPPSKLIGTSGTNKI